MDVFDLVAKISLDQSEYNSGLDGIRGGFSSLGSEISSGFQTAFTVGAAAITAATGAVVAFGSSAVSAGMDFDSAMSQVAATMGMTNDQLENTRVTTENFSGTLREFAQELGSTTAFSATQAAEALNFMALAGYDAETSVKMLPNVLNLAAAGGMELATASDMVTDAQTALGLSIEDTEKLVDQMAKTSSSSNTSVAQLGDAILTVGGTAKMMAGGTTELSTALGILADNGTKGSEGGTKLRNILLSLGAPTDTAAGALESLGVSAYDADGNMRPLQDTFADLNKAMEKMTTSEKTNIINTVFNKTDIKDVNALLNTSAERWEELSGKIDDSKGAAEQMAATQLDNLAGDITLFKSALEGAQIAVSDQLTPTLREFVQFGSDGLSRLTQAFNEGGLTGAMDVLGELLSEGLAMVIEKVPEMVEAGVQLLTALVDGIVDNLPVLTEAAIKILPTIIDGITKVLPQLITAGLTILKSLAGAITDNLDTIIPAAMEIITAVAKALIEYRVLLLEVGLQVIIALAEYMIESLPEMINYIIQVVEHVVKVIIDNLPLLLDAAVRILEALAEYLGDNLDEIIDSTIAIIEKIVEILLDHLDELINAALKIIVAISTGLVKHMPELIKKVPEIIKAIVSTLIENLPQIILAALEIMIAFGDGLIQSLPDLVLLIPEILDALVDGLMDGIDDIKDAGMNLIGGFWEGIKEKWSGLVDDVKGLGNGFIEKIENVFDIHSPSRVFKRIGELCVEGLDEGSEELFGTDGLTATVKADVETTSSTNADRLNTVLDLLEEYLPNMATKDSFNDVSFSLNNREFGRLVNGVI